MKKTTRMLFVLCLVTMGALFSPEKTSAQDVNIQIFYDQLSPYGSWVSDPNYGYVWVPQADPNFTPYGTEGHWEWSDDGWLWVSDYPWGWAPFHYGRWNYDYNYGWMWIPGTTWGPAWVEWRSSPGYYGWCPLGPGIGINGYASYNPPADRWVFVRDRYINSPRITQYYERRENNAGIYNRTRIIDNRHMDNARHTTYFAGPRREDVQKATGTQIKPVVIRDNARPGQTSVARGEVAIYRPAVRKSVANAPKPAPRSVAPISNLKPIPGGHSASRPAAAPNQPQREKQAAPHVNNNAQPHNQAQPQRQQPQQAAPHVNTPQPHSQPKQQAAPKPAQRQQPQQAAPHVNAPQPQRQQPQQAAPHVNNNPHNLPQQQRAPAPAPQINRPAPQQQRPQVQPQPRAEPPHQEATKAGRAKAKVIN